jgi:polyhydroxyalkanoate synthesis regulator phasin
MEKIINTLINSSTQGVDTYRHNDSTWLIFTETKQWVIELTESKTLWYNYNFFKNIFNYVSLDVVDNQQYITKWVEDNIIDNSVRHTDWVPETNHHFVDEALENGVKETKISPTYTEYGDWLDGDERLDDIIDNGVKETQFNWHENKSWVEGVINGGVKETRLEQNITEGEIDDIIQEGVKKTLWISTEREWLVETTINNGVIKNGVKEVHPLPAQDWNGDWGKYYHGKEDRTKPFNEYLNDALEIGVKIN